jgi:hypothetical protein
MTVTPITSRSVEQTQPIKVTKQRAMHSPPRTTATRLTVDMTVNEATEIETVRLRKAGATTVIFRDQMTGTAVELTLPDADLLRMLGLIQTVQDGTKREAV